MGASDGQQPGLSFGDLYAQAAEARPFLESFGQKLLTDIRQLFPGKFDDARLDVAQLKDEERALAKVDVDYGGDASRITDLVRGRVVVQTKEQADLLRQYLAEHKDSLNLNNIKDRFANPSVTGFRDELTTVKLENGHVAEFRVEQQDMLHAAKLTHGPYKQIQQIERTANSQNRPLTETERDQFFETRDKIRDTNQVAADKAGLDDLLNHEGREKLKKFQTERVTPPSTGYYENNAPLASADQQTPASPQKQVAPSQPKTDATSGGTAPVTQPGASNAPEVPEIHEPEIHEPSVHGKGGIITSVVISIAVTGAALLSGAKPAQAALEGGKTIIDGAIPGVSNGFKDLRQPHQSTLDKALNWADTGTGTVATASGITTLASAPTIETGVGAVVFAGAGLATVVAGAANLAVGLTSDSLTYAGVTKRGGPIHGLVDMAKPYIDGVDKLIHGTDMQPTDHSPSATRHYDEPAKSVDMYNYGRRGPRRGAMRSMIAQHEPKAAAPPNSANISARGTDTSAAPAKPHVVKLLVTP